MTVKGDQVLLLNGNEGRHQKLDRNKRSGENCVSGPISSQWLFQYLAMARLTMPSPTRFMEMHEFLVELSSICFGGPALLTSL